MSGHIMRNPRTSLLSAWHKMLFPSVNLHQLAPLQRTSSSYCL